MLPGDVDSVLQWWFSPGHADSFLAKLSTTKRLLDNLLLHLPNLGFLAYFSFFSFDHTYLSRIFMLMQFSDHPLLKGIQNYMITFCAAVENHRTQKLPSITLSFMQLIFIKLYIYIFFNGWYKTSRLHYSVYIVFNRPYISLESIYTNCETMFVRRHYPVGPV